MSETKQILENIIKDFSPEKFIRFFREKSRQFAESEENMAYLDDDSFLNGQKLGEIKFSDGDQLIVCVFQVTKELSERAGKKKQYEKAKDILKNNQNFSAGIFIFSDTAGNFRFSLVYDIPIGNRREWNNFRRFTYFVSKEFTNKTFLKQIGGKEFAKLDDIKAAFSITAVTNIFYDEFFKIYDKVVKETKKINNIAKEENVRDFVLLFAIRTIFIGFIQKKKWIGDDVKFIQFFFKEYKDKFFGQNKFYSRWLSPLFFEALNSPQGRKVAYMNNDFSTDTESKLQMAPYLNGGLFREKRDYDDHGWIIPDQEIKEFFDFLFAHSFTIEENSLEDEDLQLNPEFLGIIFERLVNKADGAVYTPRTEVDFMCRLSLVKWLQKNLENPVKVKAVNLYELFFRESEKEEDQKQGSFSRKEAQEILEKLENLAIGDPAVGSGAFLVGMMQVLDEIEQTLKNKYSLDGKNVFDRKKEIIKKSLYGVEVKEWAVWICQLRLWLSLFVDAPDDLKNSLTPILPSLDFKVRQGDSLVQRIGSKTFPVEGHLTIQSVSIKKKITELKKFKISYFDNDKNSLIRGFDNPYRRELAIFNEILDLEIKEKEDRLKILKKFKPAKNITLFGEKEIEQPMLDFNKKEIVETETEISELKIQKQALRSGGKSLVWNIEFAEVFAEKGGFDIIIGNPPYVRQEGIADPTGKIKNKKEYKDFLPEMAKLDFPADFPPKMKINAQSDLYVYFYIRGLRLLNSKGVHTFICSNSWLDVGYGAWLQSFLLKRCPIYFIIDNHAKRSFEAADVNTIISVIGAPQKKINENHKTKFVAFKKPFEEAIFTENLLAIEDAEKVVSNDIFRVYPIAIKDLEEAGMEYDGEEQKKMKLGKYVGDKWGGKYLRAPDIFFTILEKGKDKLVKLGDIAEVRFGIKTGVNKFFYLTNEQIAKWKIEKEFLKPVIKSPRECKSILVDPKDLKYKIFICNKSKVELKGTNALRYIEWGESKKFNKIPTVSNRKYWWQNPDFGSKIFMQMSYNDIFRFWYSKDEIRCDARLYTISLKSEEDVYLLNSTISAFIIELFGRANLGEGALDFKVYEADQILVLDKEKIKTKINREIFLRPIKSIFEECGIDPKSDVPIEKQIPKPLPDRAELDKIVFDALDL
ncbi:MAG: DNA methyltransferase, partial [Patescibacteria group bacterium]